MSASDFSLEARLTSLSHGGGCGCKIAPDLLKKLVADTFPTGAFPNLMVGNQSADDAAVYRLNDEQALIATTDFFMPIVDSPRDFGRIAATNARSDIYAMGGTPILALALVGMPISKISTETINAILKGGAEVCESVQVPIAGGHSIDSVEPIYGLAVMGLAHPDHIRTNDAAQAGDVLILSKALGVGVLSAALKKNLLSGEQYDAMIRSTTQPNTPGPKLAKLDAVHALTDVTGFSLVGHTLELCRGAGLSAKIDFSSLPWLPGAVDYAKDGIVTGASGRNWNACKDQASVSDTLPSYAQALVTDPQTSGGLLVACAADAVEEVLSILREDGFEHSTVIGTLHLGSPFVSVV